MKKPLSQDELVAILNGENEDVSVVESDMGEMRPDGVQVVAVLRWEDEDGEIDYWRGIYVRLFTGTPDCGFGRCRESIRPDWPADSPRPYQFWDVYREETAEPVVRYDP